MIYLAPSCHRRQRGKIYATYSAEPPGEHPPAGAGRVHMAWPLGRRSRSVCESPRSRGVDRPWLVELLNRWCCPIVAAWESRSRSLPRALTIPAYASRWGWRYRRCAPAAARRRRKPAKLHAGKAHPELRWWVRDRGIKIRIAPKVIESSTTLGKHRWPIRLVSADILAQRTADRGINTATCRANGARKGRTLTLWRGVRPRPATRRRSSSTDGWTTRAC